MPKQLNVGALFKARVVEGRVGENLFDRGLCLPSGTVMSDADMERVFKIILNCRNKGL